MLNLDVESIYKELKFYVHLHQDILCWNSVRLFPFQEPSAHVKALAVSCCFTYFTAQYLLLWD
jgi:hypothetical protein